MAPSMKPEELEQIGRSPGDVGFTEPAQPARELKIFDGGERWINRRFFRNVADAAFESDEVLADVFAIEENPSGGRLDKACEHLHGGGFPGTIRSEISSDLSRIQA